MKIEIRPPDGIIIIGEHLKECMIFHLYCDDGLENGIDIILTEKQMEDLKKEINKHSDI